jgi:pimeloyl-ACP methyl ester carboxylesterase
MRVTNSGLKCSVMGDHGPLIVLLHGYGGGPLDWRQSINRLEKNHRILLLNLTGLWSSKVPIGFAKQVDLLAGFLANEIAQSEKFVVVGASYGGLLSWALRAHFKERVKGHVMVNPMPLNPLPVFSDAHLRMLFGLNMVPGALPLYLKTPMGRKLLHELGAAFGFGQEGRRGLIGMSEKKLLLINKAVQRFAWIAQTENWSAWQDVLKDHHIPLLLLTGEDDPLFNEQDVRRFQQWVPLSEHQSIQTGGHLLTKSHGEDVALRLIDFVRSLDDDPHGNVKVGRAG